MQPSCLKLVILFLLFTCRGLLAAELDADYSSTHRAVLYKGAPVFTVATNLISEQFKGPIVLADSIVFVGSVHREVLAFRTGKQLKRVKIRGRPPKFFYPNRPLFNVVVSLGDSLLLYDTDGYAYTVDKNIKATRRPKLFVSPEKYGSGKLVQLSPVTNQIVSIPFVISKPNQFTLQVDVRKLEKVGDPK